MIPVRVLVVGETSPGLYELREELELDGFEVSVATTPASGLLALARREPDILVLDPYAGSGRLPEWKRAIERYRGARPLGLIVTTDETALKDRRILLELADLGVVQKPIEIRKLRSLLSGWAGHTESILLVG